jgi:hypothetical protein
MVAVLFEQLANSPTTTTSNHRPRHRLGCWFAVRFGTERGSVMSLMVAMVMLNEDQPLDMPAIQRFLAESWDDTPRIEDIDSQNDVAIFQLGEQRMILAKMPAPIPWSDLEGPCETSLLWPTATTDIRPHRVHWIVTSTAESDAVSLARTTTKLCAAVCQTVSSAIGVYWGSASLVIPKGLFVEMAVKAMPVELPLYLWLDVRVGQDGEGTSEFTMGMKAFGHMELEAIQVPEAPDDLHNRLFSMANYLIENGPVISDGDTIGSDENERTQVVYSDSQYGHAAQVMRLVYRPI